MENNPAQNSEIVTVEEFAERMKVSRTTVFAWIKTGSLKEGVHYIRLGRILRLCWREGLFFNSQLRANEDEGPLSPPLPAMGTLDSQRGEATVNSPPLPLTLKREPGPIINLDY